MMVSVEGCLRRWQKQTARLALDPRVRSVGRVLGWGSSAFLLSGASLMNAPVPLAMGLICAAGGWQAVVMSLGAMVGYPLFWGPAGIQGVVWACTAGVLTLLVGQGEERQDRPLMIPVISAFLTAAAGLCFQLLLGDGTGIEMFLLRAVVSLLAGMLFTQAFYCRDAISDWLVCGVIALALAQSVVLGMSLGHVFAGFLAAVGAFPAAALAGLGLDLAGITGVPMTAVMCLSYFLRLIPLRKTWQRYLMPGAAYLAVMGICGQRQLTPLPPLVLGALLGALRIPVTGLRQRRGSTGAAQVRLELGARTMRFSQQMILEMDMPPIDRQALLLKARERACTGCSARNSCGWKDALTEEYLEDPLEVDCRKPGRLVPELSRARDQLKVLKAQRQRLGQYRGALAQQYGFLSLYMQSLADGLSRRDGEAEAQYRIQVSARSRGRERANGDRCAAFPGPGCCYYVLLCDGMGTGLGAAEEGSRAMTLLRRMLCAGFPPEHALSSYNSLLALGDRAGAVTVDLAQVQLDTGLAVLHKWGAAPSWLLDRHRGKKIGTATAPPGIWATGSREKAEKLSLRRGETLILASDGVDGEDVLRQCSVSADMPPGELAAKILLAGSGDGEDDATVIALRLCPADLELS